MASLIQPLSSQVPIVDDEGKPLPSFITMLQKLGVGTGLDGSSGSIALAAMAAKTILANKTGASAAPTACTLSDILDFVTTTRGSLLYRGVSGWAALAPGTAGNVLQTNGSGTDPTWAAAGGGSGIVLVPPKSSDFTTTVNTPDTTNGTYALKIGRATNTVGINGYLKVSPTLPFTVTIMLDGIFGSDFNSAGILVRDSANKVVWCLIGNNSGRVIGFEQWTNVNTFSTSAATLALANSGYPKWLQITVNVSNQVSFSYSYSGDDWEPLVTNNAFLGTVNAVGIGVVRNNASVKPVAWFQHYVTT